MNTMNIKTLQNSPPSLRRKAAGMTLLDILLAIVIFAIGMVALAQLQGNLSRSSGDANARTVAANIAEEVIESLRTYDRLEVDAADACPTALDAMQTKKVFECIADPSATLTLARGGINYTVDLEVTDWYYTGDRETLTSDTSHSDIQGRDLSISDFKGIRVTVDWDVIDFRVDEASTADLGTGSFVANTTIPSIPVLGGAKIAADDDGLPGTPPVAYTPGQLPDVLPITLVDGQRFKESTTPMPDVIRSDYIVETWFDVITYSTDLSNNSTYLRREEFAMVACECTLRDPVGAEGDGFLPTTWNGADYSEGAWVSKQWGESANNQQSQYCDTCCRDHHDVSGNTDEDTLYRPFSGATHGHYYPTRGGGWDEATRDGDDYLEVCRMVRKDGFMRVAQDFELKGLLATRQAFFADPANVSPYSTHVTDAALSEFQTHNNDFSTGLTLPGDAQNNAIPLPRATDSADFDQQVSRALYTDYVNSDLQAALNCLGQNYDASCAPPGVTTPLEVLPFYEVQTTWLSFWRDNVDGKPVFITNETLKTDNTHSRGMAELTTSSSDTIRAETYLNRGNVGLTSTDPIEDNYNLNLEYYELFIDANGGGGGASLYPYGVSGTMSGTGGIKTADARFVPSEGVYCTHDASTFKCSYDENAVSPSFRIEGYKPNNKDAWVCDTTGTLSPINQQPTLGTVEFNLSGIGFNMVTDIHLSFQTSACP